MYVLCNMYTFKCIFLEELACFLTHKLGCKHYSDGTDRETSVSLHHRGPINTPLKHLKYHGSVVLMGLRGPSIGPPLCREARASQTDAAFFCSPV